MIDVILVSLSTNLEVWLSRTQWKIYDRAFLAIHWTKDKIFNWVPNTPLKLWTEFTLITWLWFGWVAWGFSTSFMSTFIQIFQNLYWLKKIQTIWCLTLRPRMPHICGFLDCLGFSHLLATSCCFYDLKLGSLNSELNFEKASQFFAFQMY